MTIDLCGSKKLRVITGSCFCLLIILLLASLRTVPPAHIAVVTTAGKLGSETLQPGVHFTSPISGIHAFSTKTIKIEQTNEVPTKEGLSVTLNVSLLFHIEPSRARDIYLNLGKNYDELVVEPELSSAVRGLTSESDAKALYTEGRNVMQKRLKEELASKLVPRGIIVEDVLLKAVKLPQQLTNSIELKAQAEQESARMAFILEKERQEAERKSIEAIGIADFQRIVSEGISEQLLQWKGIEATERLAQSSNAKVVFVGNSQDSLPVLLSDAK
jgi:regulator of protease activity HflC (stomatin/prohibitin superfamily)